MFLERTISQLDVGYLEPERASELGQMGYMQWLGWLPGSADYHHTARHALTVAAPFAAVSPAVAVFCDLVGASLDMPPKPLALKLPERRRRGGHKARRANTQ